MKCLYCSYEWIPRKKQPKECPACKSEELNIVIPDEVECRDCKRSFNLKEVVKRILSQTYETKIDID